jgi:serine/threonine-protein kinase
MSCYYCTKIGKENIQELLFTKDIDKLESKYKNIKLLASGGTSVVYSALHKLLDRKVALKIINEEYALNPRNMLYNELSGHLRIQKENYIKKHIPIIYNIQYMNVESVIKGSRPRIVIEMDLIEAPTLLEELNFNNSVMISAFKQGLLFIQRMNDIGYIHRDLKMENMSYDTDTDTLYIFDFSFICNTPCNKSCIESCQGNPGSDSYIHPEILDPDEKTESYVNADIYDMALTILYYISGGYYSWNPSESSFHNISNRNRYIMENIKKLKEQDEHLANILNSILIADRPTFIRAERALKDIPSTEKILKELNNVSKYNKMTLIEMIIHGAQYANEKPLETVFNMI